MKSSKKSPKGSKAKTKTKTKRNDSEELRKPTKLAPAKVKGKGRENKNWKNQIADEEEEFEDLPLDEDFKGFDDFYEDEDEEDF